MLLCIHSLGPGASGATIRVPRARIRVGFDASDADASDADDLGATRWVADAGGGSIVVVHRVEMVHLQDEHARVPHAPRLRVPPVAFL